MGYYVNVETDVNIYVEDIHPNSNKTILFIHGWPLSHKTFEYQFNQLPKMGYRCIGVDLRGFGNSDKPWQGYSYDRMADDIRRVIDKLKLKNITLGGHSMGGAIAIRYMARHNGHGVSKLALFAAAAPSFTRRANFPYGLTKEQADAFLEQANNDRPQLLQVFGNMFFFQYITQAFSEWSFQIGLQAAGWATIATLTSLRDESLFSDLGKINVPTLILHGIHDKVCPFELGEAQKEGIKNSKLVPFIYSGHGLYYDERDKFNEELTQFIEE